MDRRSCFPFCVTVMLVHCLAMNNGMMITTDQSALLALKAHVTSDPHGILSTNWSAATSACDWIGVACSSRHRRVTALNMSNMGVVGTIPPHIGNLSFLASLDVSSNRFRGELPEELAQLRRLKFLGLSFNNLNGVLPAWFEALPRLQHLILNGNGFTGPIPLSLTNISKLETLLLHFNSLQGKIPQEIGNLGNLKILDMSNNHLTGSIPLTIFNISSLQNLSIRTSGLSGNLPVDMCQGLPNLKSLDLFDNELYGDIPRTISRCSELQLLRLQRNRFSGQIPREIGNFTMLKTLNLGDNNLPGAIPDEIGNLDDLEILWMGINRLSGSIPTKIFNMSALKTLQVVFNQLSGHLPSSMGLWLPNLERLSIGENELYGVIPDSISNASKLTILYIPNNFLNGFVPRTFGNLRFLRRLIFGSNNFTCESSTSELTFLSSLTNCRHLEWLEFSFNPLNGVLPVSIGNLSTSLQKFAAFGSKIKGNIPSGIGNLTSLIDLRLQSNELIGSIPTTVGRLHNLQRLDLSDNKLHGFIPNDLCDLKNLGDLILSANNLSVPIPTCLGEVYSLRNVYLDSNKLTSMIPSTLLSLEDILVLNLSSNSLSGSLPSEIGNMKVVTQIDLSWNHLSGTIPPTIGSIQTLASLCLAHNRLQGPIFESFGDMLSLEFLDLSNNNLSSVIPKSLENLSYLKYLNLTCNRLKGEIPSGGPFVNFSAQSFFMNEALCGSSRLQVPPCKYGKNTHRITIVLLLKYILPITGSSALVLAFLFLLRGWRRQRMESVSQESLLHLSWRKIAYQELVQATNGFSESNLLGEGGFGSIYKGTLVGVEVAIKVFNLRLNDGAFKSFDVACEIMRNIRHRNLVRVISSCTNIDFKALILEYMPNGSLEKWLYSHNYFLNLQQRLDIMIDVASALDYLHHGYTTPVVHCDLKPTNILLDEDMVGHISDFGIAKLIGEREFMAQTKTLGTIGYMAPEYGLEGITSTRGDVYSYAIMLMETFTRKKPTDEMFAGEMSLKHWVSYTLHNSITEAMDPTLLGEQTEHLNSKKQCVSSILGLAVECSVDSPKERINIKDVVVRLNKIKIMISGNIQMSHPQPSVQDVRIWKGTEEVGEVNDDRYSYPISGKGCSEANIERCKIKRDPISSLSGKS